MAARAERVGTCVGRGCHVLDRLHGTWCRHGGHCFDTRSRETLSRACLCWATLGDGKWTTGTAASPSIPSKQVAASSQDMHPPPRRRKVLEVGGEGGLGPKSLCTKMGGPDFPDCKVRFFPRWSLWSRGGGVLWGEGVNPPPPMVHGIVPWQPPPPPGPLSAPSPWNCGPTNTPTKLLTWWHGLMNGGCHRCNCTLTASGASVARLCLQPNPFPLWHMNTCLQHQRRISHMW